MSEAIGCDAFREALFALVDCEECEERRSLIDTGTVEGPCERERLALIAHASGCEHCAQDLDHERHVRTALRHFFDDEPLPEGFEARLLARLSSVQVETTSVYVETSGQ